MFPNRVTVTHPPGWLRVTIAQADPGMLPDVPELCFADERKGARRAQIG